MIVTTFVMYTVMLVSDMTICVQAHLKADTFAQVHACTQIQSVLLHHIHPKPSLPFLHYFHPTLSPCPPPFLRPNTHSGYVFNCKGWRLLDADDTGCPKSTVIRGGIANIDFYVAKFTSF